jgi:PHS family inorganic phosphate transporter-like MFS transporter
MAANNKTVGGNAAFHNFNNDFAHIDDPNERRRLALAEIDKVGHTPSQHCLNPNT